MATIRKRGDAMPLAPRIERASVVHECQSIELDGTIYTPKYFDVPPTVTPPKGVVALPSATGMLWLVPSLGDAIPTLRVVHPD